MAGPALTRPFWRSFAGGEITPELFGRLDLDKFQTGLKQAKNFRILPHGPAQNRSGFRYVLETKDSTKASRLVPFVWSVDQTMHLEFGDGYIRFHTLGATLLETGLTITGISQASPGVLTYTGTDPSNGNWMYLSGISGMTELNGRFVKVAAVNAGANTFQLTDIHGGAAIDTTGFGAWTSGGTAARVYEIASPYAEADLFDLHFVQSSDVLTITHPSYAVRELRRSGATNWAITSATFAPAIATPAAPTVTADTSGGAGTPIAHRYVTTAISEATFEESLGSASAFVLNDLTVAGNSNSITPAAVAGSVRYYIYKRGNGGLYGYIGQSDGTALVDDNITPDLTLSPPEANNPFNGAGNWPSTVTYCEQRRCFAATNNNPQSVWMSRSATEGNFSQHVPLNDADAIIFRVKSRQQNRTRHLVELVDLVALTTDGEIRIFAQNSDAFTPASTTPKKMSYVGASNVQPAVAENAILYEAAQGGHIREFAYAADGVSGKVYSSSDISILAPHLFDGHTMVDMAFSRTATCPTLFVVRDDGVMTCLTYVPGQNIRAWSWFDTQGTFESVSTAPEGAEEPPYVIVQREINGRQVRNVEVLHTRTFDDKVDAFFVDAGLVYDGAPTTEISGLWHLAGSESVSVKADGAVLTGYSVDSTGRLTPDLPVEASVVHVGLGYSCRFESLPVSWPADGYGQGVLKNVSKVHLRLSQSSGVLAGPSDEKLVEVKQRTTENYDDAPELMDGWRHTNIPGTWQDDGSVVVAQEDPLPVTILAMVLEVVAGG